MGTRPRPMWWWNAVKPWGTSTDNAVLPPHRDPEEPTLDPEAVEVSSEFAERCRERLSVPFDGRIAVSNRAGPIGRGQSGWFSRPGSAGLGQPGGPTWRCRLITLPKAWGSLGVRKGRTRWPTSTKNPTDFRGRCGSRFAQCLRSPEPQIRPFPRRAVMEKRSNERTDVYGIVLVPQGK